MVWVIKVLDLELYREKKVIWENYDVLYSVLGWFFFKGVLFRLMVSVGMEIE